MATPRDKTARQFYRVAEQRWDDAQFLLGAGRELSAVYLAGYSIECLLKALIFSQVAEHDRAAMLSSFRGVKAHDFDWLRDVYFRRGGSRFPPDVVEAFSDVVFWGVDLRYQPGTLDEDEVAKFFAAARTIRSWAKARL